MVGTILNLGDSKEESPNTTIPEEKYLIKDQALGDMNTEELARARYHLNVLSADETLSSEDVLKEIGKAISDYRSEVESEQIELNNLIQQLQNTINSGSVNKSIKYEGYQRTRTAPASEDNKDVLTTQEFVNKQISSNKQTIIKEITELISNKLSQYIKAGDVYTTNEVFTKDELNATLKNYLQKNKEITFTKAVRGLYPKLNSDFATKGYIDEVISKHEEKYNAHQFINLINTRLSSYIKRSEIFTKSETYSRSDIDNIVYTLVETAVKQEIDHYQYNVDAQLEAIRKEAFIKQDGSIPFSKPQAGQDAIKQTDLVTLRQLQSLKNQLEEVISSKECQWITSGPSEASVGNIELNTEFPETLSFQEIMDAIFYGKGISLHVPEYVNIAESCEITICVHGSTGLIEYAELLQDEKQLSIFSKEDFENGCVTVDSEILEKDTDFTFRVIYSNGAIHEEIKTVKVSIPIFAGIIPKWKFGQTIQYNYLSSLTKSDPENNQFYSVGTDVVKINHKYSFDGKDLYKLVLIVPVDGYPDLYQLQIPSQQFGVDAFEPVNVIPLSIPGVKREIPYKIYVYKEYLTGMNQEVAYKFVK